MQERRGHDKFHSFYRYFLLRLFHEGLGQRERVAPSSTRCWATCPTSTAACSTYTNLEQRQHAHRDPRRGLRAASSTSSTPTSGTWTSARCAPTTRSTPTCSATSSRSTSTRSRWAPTTPRRTSPSYIGQNTIIPFLFDAAEQECAIAFRPDGALWRLLRDDPDRYIYPAVRKASTCPLPAEIAAGWHDVTRREGWNSRADASYALPTETWREHVARRTRCEELRAQTRSRRGHAHRRPDHRQPGHPPVRAGRDRALRGAGAAARLLPRHRAASRSSTRRAARARSCSPRSTSWSRSTKPASTACRASWTTATAPARTEAAPRETSPTSARCWRGCEQHPNRDYFVLKSIIIEQPLRRGHHGRGRGDLQAAPLPQAGGAGRAAARNTSSRCPTSTSTSAPATRWSASPRYDEVQRPPWAASSTSTTRWSASARTPRSPTAPTACSAASRPSYGGSVTAADKAELRHNLRSPGRDARPLPGRGIRRRRRRRGRLRAVARQPPALPLVRRVLRHHGAWRVRCDDRESP